MPTDSDRQYLDAAVDARLMSRARADEVIDLAIKYEDLGMSASAQELAVKKEFLTADQAESLARSMTAKIRITGYDIIEKVGAGGMGSVWRAKQTALDRDVAIKILPPSAAGDSAFVETFMREARAVAKLNHENIVQGIDFGESNGLYYFAMEFIDGPTVKELVDGSGMLTEARALDIAEGVCRGLAHAHAAGIVHLDVKPANVILTLGGIAKVVDLGLARGYGKDSVQAGMAVGTPHYMSPEQASGSEHIDLRTDLYSLGTTMYYMLTGRPPFEAEKSSEVMLKHVEAEAVPVREARRDVSAGTSKLIEKLMAKAPGDRPQTAGDVIAEIERIRTGAPPSSQSVRRGDRRGSLGRTPSQGAPVGATIAIVVAVVVIGLIAVALLSSSSAPEGRPVRRRRIDGPAPKVETVKPRENAQPAEKKRMPDLAAMSEEQIRAYIEADPGGEFADAARSRMRLLAESREAAEKAEAEFEKLIAAGRFTDAWTMAAGGETGRISRRDANDKVQAAALARLKALRTRAAKPSSLTAKDIDALLASLGKLDLGSMATLDKMRIETASALKSEVAARERRAEAAYAEFSGGFLESLGKGDRDGARKVARDVLRVRNLSGCHERVRNDVARIAWLEDVAAKALDGVKTLVGQRRTFVQRSGARLAGKVTGVSGGRVTVTVGTRGSAEMSVPLDKLADGELVTLARLAAPDNAEWHRKFCFALLVGGHVGEAEAELALLAKRKEDAAGLDGLLKIVRAGAAEHAASLYWAGIERESSAGRWKEAVALADEFEKKYGATDFARLKAGAIKGIRARAETAKLAGKPLASPDGLLLYCPFDDGKADALIAKGKPAAKVKNIAFTPKGHLNGAVRIKSGGSIAYERPGNMKLAEGTIMLWARGPAPRSLWNSHDATRSLLSCGAGDDRFPFSTSDGRLRLSTKNSDGDTGGVSGGRWLMRKWDDTKWHHAAVCWRVEDEEATMLIYADGIEVGRNGGTDAPSGLDDAILLGLYSRDQMPFDGWMDELYVHDRMLQPEEIRAAARLKPAPERRWQRIFNLFDDDGLNLDNGFDIDDGRLVRDGRGAMQSRKAYSDGEIESPFKITGGSHFFFAVRQGAAGTCSVTYGKSSLVSLADQWHSLRFTMSADKVTATLDGKPAAVSARGNPKSGRIQIGGDGSGLVIREIRYRPLAK